MKFAETKIMQVFILEEDRLWGHAPGKMVRS